MIKNKKLLFFAVALFLFAEAMLGYLYQQKSFRGHDQCGFALVLLSAVFCLIFFNGSKRYCFTQAALIFTVGADFFLVILDELYTVGVILFLIAQVFYMLRIISDTKDKNERKLQLWIRGAAAIAAAVITVAVLGRDSDTLSVISVLYYSFLLMNAVFAFTALRLDARGSIFAVGLLLFVVCDLFVGLGNLSDYLPISKDSVFFSAIFGKVNIPWVFYTPSQALLGISLLPYQLYEKQ